MSLVRIAVPFTNADAKMISHLSAAGKEFVAEIDGSDACRQAESCVGAFRRLPCYRPAQPDDGRALTDAPLDEGFFHFGGAVALL